MTDLFSSHKLKQNAVMKTAVHDSIYINEIAKNMLEFLKRDMELEDQLMILRIFLKVYIFNNLNFLKELNMANAKISTKGWDSSVMDSLDALSIIVKRKNIKNEIELDEF